MRLLLDTHVLLWWLDDPSQLPEAANQAISDESNVVYVSAVVIWEISIKRGLGKLDAPDDIEAVLRANRFLAPPVTIAHALVSPTLARIHRDPFDRMLIAQAIHENLTLVSRDPNAPPYGVAHIVA